MKKSKPKLGDRKIYYTRHEIEYHAYEPGFDDGWVHMSSKELPPDARVLTREQVIAACLKHAKAWDFEDKIANELFGGEG